MVFECTFFFTEKEDHSRKVFVMQRTSTPEQNKDIGKTMYILLFFKKCRNFFLICTENIELSSNTFSESPETNFTKKSVYQWPQKNAFYQYSNSTHEIISEKNDYFPEIPNETKSSMNGFDFDIDVFKSKNTIFFFKDTFSVLHYFRQFK